jgi:anthranilate phosphoribosyltransferase
MLRFRQAVLDGATVEELTSFADELKRRLPGPAPPPPAAMFIHADIVITCGEENMSTPLVTALWVPDALRRGGW